MQTVFLFLGFLAIWLGSTRVAWTSWRIHHSGHRHAGVYTKALLAWFVTTSALAGVALFSPNLRFPAWLLPVSVVALSAAYFAVLRIVSPDARSTWPQTLKLQRWRAYFGGLIVLGAATEVLPWSFALTAGLGDIAVGVWAAWLHRRVSAGKQLGVPMVLAFTAFGIADLVNAGRLGASLVLPWLIERQMPGFILLLPIFGVPIMMASHFWMLRGYWTDRKAPRTKNSQRDEGNQNAIYFIAQ
jgi:hypothetical protein